MSDFTTKDFKTLFGRPIIDSEGRGEGLITISKEHAMTHAGRMFSARVEASIASDASLYMQIKIPEGIEMHLKEFTLYTPGSSATLTITENPTVTDGTTGVTPKNRHRASSNPSVVTIYSDPTSISGGDELDSVTYEGGNPQDAVGDRSTDREWVLVEGDYIFELVNNDASTQIMSMEGYWYEEKEGSGISI